MGKGEGNGEDSEEVLQLLIPKENDVLYRRIR